MDQRHCSWSWRVFLEPCRHQCRTLSAIWWSICFSFFFFRSAFLLRGLTVTPSMLPTGQDMRSGLSPVALVLLLEMSRPVLCPSVVFAFDFVLLWSSRASDTRTALVFRGGLARERACTTTLSYIGSLVLGSLYIRGWGVLFPFFLSFFLPTFLDCFLSSLLRVMKMEEFRASCA